MHYKLSTIGASADFRGPLLGAIRAARQMDDQYQRPWGVCIHVGERMVATVEGADVCFTSDPAARHYQITSASGEDYGVWEGADAQEAFARMVSDGGDGVDTDGDSTAGDFSRWNFLEVDEWWAWIEGDRDSAVPFWLPIGETAGAEQAGAEALGADVGDPVRVGQLAKL